MKTLEEVQAQFESKDKSGHEVNILACHHGQEYPIIAEVKYGGGWSPSQYAEDGTVPGGEPLSCNLIKKRPHLPKDILCEVWDNCFPDVRPKVYSDGTGLFFISGANSASSSGATKWDNYRVIETLPQPWFGGDCPIPEGCEFRVRVGGIWFPGEEDRTAHSWELVNRITAYQILGEKESK